MAASRLTRTLILTGAGDVDDDGLGDDATKKMPAGFPRCWERSACRCSQTSCGNPAPSLSVAGVVKMASLSPAAR